MECERWIFALCFVVLAFLIVHKIDVDCNDAKRFRDFVNDGSSLELDRFLLEARTAYGRERVRTLCARYVRPGCALVRNAGKMEFCEKLKLLCDERV